MSDKIIHLPDPDIDYSLCGDSDDGVMVDGGQPNYNTNGESVNCPRCLRIIAVCKEYAAQQSVQRTAFPSCPKCGAKVSHSWRKCGACGYRNTANASR